MRGGARWVRMWVVVEDGGEVVCEWGLDWREEERGTRRGARAGKAREYKDASGSGGAGAAWEH